MQRPRAISLVTACAVLVPLGACGDPESSRPPAASAQAVPATTSAANLAPRPDDGCSSDNSPTDVVAAPGPAPEVAVRPESANSPLPDLAVRRINCAGGWVNLRNEIPADRPVLVWFWAPY